jgi:hypothetical protein
MRPAATSGSQAILPPVPNDHVTAVSSYRYWLPLLSGLLSHASRLASLVWIQLVGGVLAADLPRCESSKAASSGRTGEVTW